MGVLLTVLLFEGILAAAIIIPSFWGFRGWGIACIIVFSLILIGVGPTAFKLMQFLITAIVAFVGFLIAHSKDW
jgi:hypothetical protein